MGQVVFLADSAVAMSGRTALLSFTVRVAGVLSREEVCLSSLPAVPQKEEPRLNLPLTKSPPVSLAGPG